MTVTEIPLTSRVSLITLDSGIVKRTLCHVHLHDWSRWEPVEFVTTEGRKSRTIVVQIRECLNCGLAQRRPL